MQTVRNELSNALGIALLLQAVASIIGGILFNPLIIKNNTVKSMFNLAQNQTRAQFSVIVEIITAMGIVWLGVVFFRLLRSIHQVGSTTALALYVLEAAMLLVSRFTGYALIRISSIYAAGDTTLKALSQVLLDTKEYIGNAALIPFGIGAVIFYYLLYVSKGIPAWISLWRVVTVIPVLLVSIFAMFHSNVPTVFQISMMPYVPFEFFTGAYILVKGLTVKL